MEGLYLVWGTFRLSLIIPPSYFNDVISMSLVTFVKETLFLFEPSLLCSKFLLICVMVVMVIFSLHNWLMLDIFRDFLIEFSLVLMLPQWLLLSLSLSSLLSLLLLLLPQSFTSRVVESEWRRKTISCSTSLPTSLSCWLTEKDDDAILNFSNCEAKINFIFERFLRPAGQKNNYTVN